MAHDVFISYSSKDKAVADGVCHGIEAAGIRCWIAPRDVLGSEDWGDAIIAAITTAKVMIVVFSSSANSSDMVKSEVAVAVDAAIPILPFRIEAIAPTGSLRLHFVKRHWLDAVTPPIEAHIATLAEVTRTLLRPLKAEEPNERRPGSSSKESQRSPQVESSGTSAASFNFEEIHVDWKDDSTSPVQPAPTEPVVAPPARAAAESVPARAESIIWAARSELPRETPPPPSGGPRTGPVRTDAADESPVQPDALQRVPAARKRGGELGVWIVLLLITALIGGAVLARDDIVALWPPAVMIYRQAGLRTEPPGNGLEIAKVTPTRSADSLTIEGDITNTTSRPLTVPKLRVVLRDAFLKELTSKVIDSPVTWLLPGESAHFKTGFDHPSNAATDVAVTFTATS